MLSSVLKSSFLAKTMNGDVKEETQVQLMLGFIKTTSPTKLVHHTKHMAAIMDLDAPHKSNVETVLHVKDAGHKKEPKFMVLKSMET